MEDNKEIGGMKMRYIKYVLIVVLGLFSVTAYAQPAVLPAKVDVSAIGAATYEIPIEVVPGTNGVQPNLTVAYNSLFGQGVIGQKWSLQGLSSISRVPQSKLYDGNISPVNYDTTDRFALNGNRLLLFSGSSYHGSNAVYCFETEDFSRITKVVSGNDVYFRQTLVDGSIVEYGRDSQSRLVVGGGNCQTWMVSKVVDVKGNSMKFFYQQSNGEIWIDHIDYTILSDNTPAYASVGFAYESMTNPNEGYVGGYMMRHSKRLKNIFVYHQGNQVRRYFFSYNSDLPYDRLFSIRLYGASDQLLTTTSFYWETPSGPMLSEDSVSTLSGEYYILAGNFDNDRMYDVFAVKKSNGRAYLMRNNGDGTFSSLMTLDFSFPTTEYRSTMTACDLNGDGIDEIVYYSSNRVAYRSLDISNPLNIVQTNLISSNGGMLLLGDFDGDGVPEPAVFEKENGKLKYCSLEGTPDASVNVPSGSKKCYAGDFNGDGKTDVIFLKQSGYAMRTFNIRSHSWESLETGTFPTSYYFFGTGDFNGDGITDVLYRDGSNWKVSIRNGNGMGTWRTVTELDATLDSDNNTKYKPFVCDFNGDGKSDIVQPGASNTALCITSKGCSNGSFAYSIEGTFLYASWQKFESGRFSLGDFDGNGIVDMVFCNPGSSSQMVKIKYFHKDELPGYYIHEINDGAGKLVDIEYSTISLMPCRYSGSGMNWMSLPLVKNMKVSAQMIPTDSTCFFYGEAQFDPERHRFIGFAQFGMKHNDMISETFFSRVPQGTTGSSFAMLIPDSVVSYVSTGVADPGSSHYMGVKSHLVQPMSDYLVSQTINTNSSCYRTNADGNVTFLPYVSNSTEYDYLKNSRTITQTTMNTAENIWRPSQQTIKKGYASGSTAIITRQFKYFTYGSMTLPNGASVVKLTRKVTKDYNSNTTTSYRLDTLSYVYSADGLLQTKKHSDNGVLSVEEGYTYNGFGVPTAVSETPRGENARTRTLTYDPTYRFVVSQTDHAGNTVSRTYNNATGRCLSETDGCGLTTQYVYDAMGRQTNVVNPDGTTRSITYNNYSGGVPRAVCHTVVLESGKPETRIYYDGLGREIHSYTDGIGHMEVVYNGLGRVEKKTVVPYRSLSTPGESKKWETFQYDVFGRVVKDSSNYKKEVYSYRPDNGDCRYNERVENKMGAITTKYYDAAGRVSMVCDEGGSVAYAYSRVNMNSKLCDRMAISHGDNVTTVITDSRGNRCKLIDPDAGTTLSSYDAWGNLLTQTDAKGDVTTMTYDNQNRMVTKTYSLNGVNDGYSYTYGTSGTSKGKVVQIRHNGNLYRLFSYDSLGRVSSDVKYIESTPYSHQYTYNANGQLYTMQYPSGFTLRYVYDSCGRLQKLLNHATNAVIYTVDSRNEMSQPAKCFFGNNTGVEYTYDGWGMLTGIKYGYKECEDPFGDPVNRGREDSTSTRDLGGGGNEAPIEPTCYVGNQYSVLQYTYNDKGYITLKKETNTNQQEGFSYDLLGRLTAVMVNNAQTYTYTYGDNGNIVKNSKLSNYDYEYGIDKPHAVTGVVDINGALPSSQCSVTYNSRNRPDTISENGWTLEIAYGSGLQREKSVVRHGDTIKSTTMFISKVCEREINSALSRYIDYIYADGRIVALHVHNITANADSLYYVQTDLLGSWDRIVDEGRSVVQSSHFDPWGNRMSSSNWTVPQDGSTLAFHRGFAGHEHYDCFGIINMNARLYDPVIGRFFSPDPQVQQPFSTQSFNRYSYCENNPVMYTDPDGEFFVIDTWIYGFFKGLFSGGDGNILESAWNTANEHALHDIQIWGGLFVSNSNLGFWERVWEVVSRFTWQLPQTILGFGSALACNYDLWGGISNIVYYDGATVITNNSKGGKAFTLGSYINGQSKLKADPNNSLFQHEYGHYLQSQTFGIFYLSRCAIPSVLNCVEWLSGDRNHSNHPVEQDANVRAFRYFKKYIDNYSGWNFKANPILGYDNGLPYDNPQNQIALNNGILHPAWYNYLLPGELILTGLINWLSLENYKD